MGKKSVLVLFVLVCAIFSGCSKKKSTSPTSGGITGEDTWTVIGYFDGNNNLDYMLNGSSYTIADVQEMEAVGSTDKMKIIVALGAMKTGGNVRYYYVEKKSGELPDSISSRVLVNLGTKDMSDQRTLQDFLSYVKSNYPAKHYVLIIDDHGSGWRGACVDDQNGSGRIMSVTNMKNAIASTLGKVDLLVFHACLMAQVEVAYEFKDCADYLLGSEFTLPMESILGSAEWLDTLRKNPSIAPVELSRRIVQAVYNAAQRKGKRTHFAAIDLKKVGILGANIGHFGNHLVTESGDHWGEVKDAWGRTHFTDYDDPAFVDLREFANNIRNTSIAPNLANNIIIRAYADTIIANINDAVVMTMTNVAGLTRGGLTIHFPSNLEQFDSTNYCHLSFRATNWHAFLSQFIRQTGTGGGGGGGGNNQVVISGIVFWPGHALANTVAFLDTSHSDEIHGILPTPVNPSTGAYQISFSLSGTLEAFIEAWQDANGNNIMDYGDGIGFYDANGNAAWDDMLRLDPGTVINNANITLMEIGPGFQFTSARNIDSRFFFIK